VARRRAAGIQLLLHTEVTGSAERLVPIKAIGLRGDAIVEAPGRLSAEIE
jgi:hypothetical protein